MRVRLDGPPRRRGVREGRNGRLGQGARLNGRPVGLSDARFDGDVFQSGVLVTLFANEGAGRFEEFGTGTVALIAFGQPATGDFFQSFAGVVPLR